MTNLPLSVFALQFEGTGEGVPGAAEVILPPAPGVGAGGAQVPVGRDSSVIQLGLEVMGALVGGCFDEATGDDGFGHGQGQVGLIQAFEAGAVGGLPVAGQAGGVGDVQVGAAQLVGVDQGV